MKRFRLIERLLPVVATLTLSACSLDELDNTGGSTDVKAEVGSLTIESLKINIDNEYIDLGSNNTITRTDTATEDSSKQWPVPNPNNATETLAGYWIEIFKKGETTPVDINPSDTEKTGLSFGVIQTLNTTPITTTSQGENVNTQTSTTTQSLKGIALAPGDYTVWAYKSEGGEADIADKAVDEEKEWAEGETPTTPAYYMGYKDITIKPNQQTAISNEDPIICKLAQVLVTVELSADMLKWFDEDDSFTSDESKKNKLTTTVTLTGGKDESAKSASHNFPYTSKHGEIKEETSDETTITKVVNGGPYVYFKNFAGTKSTDGNTLDILMKGVYLNVKPGQLDTYVDTDGSIKSEGKNYLKPIEWKQSLSTVMAAQWRQISIDIDHNNTGQVTFAVTVSNYVFDNEINVDVTKTFTTLNFSEEQVADIHDDAPSAVLVNNQQEPLNTSTYNISDDKYNESSGGWTDFLNVKVCPKAGAKIKEVYAVIESEAAEGSTKDLAGDLEDKGFVGGRVPLYQGEATTAAATDISGYLNVNPQTDGSIVFALSNKGMSVMSQYKGTHTVTVWTEDDQYRKKPTTLTITVTSEGQNIGGGTGAGPTIEGPTSDFFKVEHELSSQDEADKFECAVNITSETGFDLFNVIIWMPTFGNGDIRDAVGGKYNETAKTTTIDLIEPDAISKLRTLGLLPEDKDSYKDLESAVFDVTRMMGTLYSVVSGECSFTIIVGDESGTTEKTMKFNIVKNQ